MISLNRLTRSKAARNAAASYFAFFSTASCGLLTIPLAVAFLAKEQIGLWTIIGQVVGYLLWLDLGVGDAIGRKIAEPIAKGDQEEVNRWWSLAIGVLGIQGAVLLVAALGIWPFWKLWFKIPPALFDEAAWLFIGSMAVAAVAMPLRAYPGILMAQHRFHWVSVTQGVMPWIQLGVFYLLLHQGLGVKAYFFSLLSSQLAGWGIFILAVHNGPDRFRLTRSAFTRARLTSLFSYSGSVAVMGLAQSIFQSLPALLLGRLGGIAMIPIYGFTNRVPGLAMSLARRTTHAFYPALQRYYVTGERDRFIAKYREVNLLTIAIGMIIAAAVLGFNRSIIAWLAGADFFAGGHTNLWFAILVIIMPFTSCLTNLLQFSGSLGKTALVVLGPLILGSLLAWPAFSTWGMAGLAATFTLIPLVTTAPYALIRGSRNCDEDPWKLCGNGIICLFASCVLCALLGWWIATDDTPQIKLMLFGRSTFQPTIRELVATLLIATMGAALCLRQIKRIRMA